MFRKQGRYATTSIWMFFRCFRYCSLFLMRLQTEENKLMVHLHVELVEPIADVLVMNINCL